MQHGGHGVHGVYLGIGHAMADDGALQGHNCCAFSEGLHDLWADHKLSLHVISAISVCVSAGAPVKAFDSKPFAACKGG